MILRRLMTRNMDMVMPDVEDLCQEVMLIVCRNLSELKDPEKLGAWIFQIAQNQVNLFFRRKYTTHRKMRELVDIESGSILSAGQIRWVWNREMKTLFHGLIRELPERHRLVVKLFFYKELSVSEIGDKLQISPQKVSDCLSYSKRVLRSKLKNLPDVQISGSETTDTGEGERE